MRYIEEIKENETVVEHYLCKQRQTGKTKAGKTFLSLVLMDKTGTVSAKVWEMNNQIRSFEENDFIKIEATAQMYMNEIQLRVSKIRRSEEGEYDPADYIPSTDKNIGEMLAQITALVQSVENTPIRKLLEAILFENAEVSKSLGTHSAAKSMHHSYMGGLAEHLLSVAQKCEFMAAQYPDANRDLLVAAALLHDVGKIYELSAFPENDYTDEGQLLGHIFMGAEMVTAAAAKIPSFPSEIALQLKHCILSHHGEFEYGAPVLPKTIEAFILHCCDNLDAKVKIFEEAVAADKTQSTWAGYNRVLARNIRKTSI